MFDGDAKPAVQCARPYTTEDHAGMLGETSVRRWIDQHEQLQDDHITSVGRWRLGRAPLRVSGRSKAHGVVLIRCGTRRHLQTAALRSPLRQSGFWTQAR